MLNLISIYDLNIILLTLISYQLVLEINNAFNPFFFLFHLLKENIRIYLYLRIFIYKMVIFISSFLLFVKQSFFTLNKLKHYYQKLNYQTFSIFYFLLLLISLQSFNAYSIIFLFYNQNSNQNFSFSKIKRFLYFQEIIVIDRIIFYRFVS